MSGSTADVSDNVDKTGSSSPSSSELRGVPPPMESGVAVPPSEEDNSGFADPESPSSKADSTSSSSEGVLVEHPAGADQDPRGLQGDQDGGILVNIDGSMLDHTEEDESVGRAEDLGRDDPFVDAPDHLVFSEGRRSAEMESSIAVIEIGENTRERQLEGEVARLRDMLVEREGECRRYKEECELIGNGIVNLRDQLHDIAQCRTLDVEGVSGYEESSDSMSLHNVVGECSEIASLLSSSMDKLVLSEALIKDLQGVSNAKDLEIEDLNSKLCEKSVSHDVIASYLDSVKNAQHDAFRDNSNASIKRILVSLSSVVQDNGSLEGSVEENICIMEKKTNLLLKKYTDFVHEVEQLAQCLGEAKLNFNVVAVDKFGLVLEAAREEMLESKNREQHLLGRIRELEDGKSIVLEELDRTKECLENCKSEVNNTKMELEQAENKFLTVKDKLSIAVSKGKSLVQQRESLKQLLAEKTHELETSLQELQKKTAALEAAEGIGEDLKHSKEVILSLETEISNREATLRIIEGDISKVEFPEEIQSTDAANRIKWLVDQIKFLEEKAIEHSKVRTALSSFDLPEAVSRSVLDYQINWLGTSFSEAQDGVKNLKYELTNMQSSLASCENQLLQAQREIENLTQSLLVEKQGKYSLQVLYEELTSNYEGATDKLSETLAEKKHLVELLGEISDSHIEGEVIGDIDTFKDECIEIIKERLNASRQASLAFMEGFQRMQELLYVRSQELILLETILEEEVLNQSERKAVFEELQSASSEILALRKQRDTLQKELEHSDEKSLFLREKLSIAVKKGKGLVQEREGLKQSIEEKNSEIESLKQHLKLRESAISEFNEQIIVLKSDLEEAQKSACEIKVERDQIGYKLLETNRTLQKIMESMEQIALPSDIHIENPMERMNLIAQHIHEAELHKVHVEQELEEKKVDSVMQGNKLAEAYATIGSLEDRLAEKETYIFSLIEEKNDVQVVKDSMELELEKLKVEAHSLSVELKEAYEALQSFKDALTKSEDRICILMDEKAESESKSKLAIATLNAKVTACMEELAGTHGNLEIQSAEVVSHLRQFSLLVKDESLPSSMTDIFKKSTESLRTITPLVEEIAKQLCSEKFQDNSGSKLKASISRLRSLPPFGHHSEDTLLSPGSKVAEDVEKTPSFAEVTTELEARTALLGERLHQFSSYVNENLSLLLQILETTKDEVFDLATQKEYLNSKVNNLEALKEAQETEISKINNLESLVDAQEIEILGLRTDVKMLLSSCSDVIQALQIDGLEMIDADADSQQQYTSSRLESESIIERSENSSIEPWKTAQKLLVTAKRVKGHMEHLLTQERIFRGTINDLEDKLNESELVAKSMKDDIDAHQESITKLEIERNSMEAFCNEMRSNLEDYQAKEIIWKNKEEEFLSLQHQLVEKGREEGKMLFSDGQLESLFGQVNKIKTPFKELESWASDQQLSNPVDKIFYIVKNVAALQQMLNSIVSERDDLRLTVALHVDEVQQLKKIVKNFSGNNEELKQKTKDLNDLTIALERIMQKFGGGGSPEERKSLDTRSLLLLLDGLILSLTEESESCRLKAQDLGTKLLASQKVVDELSTKVRLLEDSTQTHSILPETKERNIFEASTSKTGSEISEVEDGGPLGRKSASPLPVAAHVRTMRKGSGDHLALSIDPESDRLISSYETDDKGHLFKSMNSSGLIPKQGKMVADRIDSVWVSGGRILMGRPEARMGLIAYSILLHLWVLATII